jgi:hypothetical protein
LSKARKHRERSPHCRLAHFPAADISKAQLMMMGSAFTRGDCHMDEADRLLRASATRSRYASDGNRHVGE